MQEVLVVATVNPPALLRLPRRSGLRLARTFWRKYISVMEKRADKALEVVLPVKLTDIKSKAQTVREAPEINLEPIPNYHL